MSARVDPVWADAMERAGVKPGGLPEPKRRDWLDISGPVQMPPPPLGTVGRILYEVSKETGVSINDLKSSRRTAKITIPRMIAYYLAKETTAKSYPEIGRRIGDRDHTTIMHGYKRISNLIKTDNALAAKVKLLRAKLEGVG